MSANLGVADAVKQGSACPEEVFTKLRAVPLLDICKEMQPMLTDEQLVVPALRVLAKAAVQRTPPLSSAEVTVLSSFFSEKASTPSFAACAAECMSAIVNDVAENDELLRQLFVAITDKFIPAIQLPERPVGVRRSCFQVMRLVVKQSIIAANALATAGRLRAILEAVDGEGDPQLVVCMLEMVRDLLTWADKGVVKDVAEDFFEALASYFPVLFTQPRGCPVTKKDLQEALSVCLTDPTLSDYCIPFLLGKITSPSTVVKIDVLQALRECIVRYPPGVILDRFAADIVAHVRSEVIKMSAFPDADDDTSPSASSPARVISAGCGTLTDIAKLCTACDSTQILQVFEPVNEGVLGAAGADASRTTCSAYATMLFSTLVGSWPVCLASGGYVFAMLSLITDGDGTQGAAGVNILMLFSAICAGFVDATSTLGKDEEAELQSQLRSKLVKALPAFSAMVRAAGAALQVQDSGTASGADAEILALCRAEFVCSALKLDVCLAPWMQDSEAEQAVSALFYGAVHQQQPSVRVRVGRLLCGFAAVDPENRCQQAALHMTDRAPLDAAAETAYADLLVELSLASQDFAMFALQEVLVPAAAGGDEEPRTTLSSGPRHTAIAAVLDAFGTFDDATAAALLERLLSSPQDPAALKSARIIFTKATDNFRHAALSQQQFAGCLATSALVCCGPAAVPELADAPPEKIQTLLDMFTEVIQGTAGGSEEDSQGGERAAQWLDVAMNGITSVVACSAGGVPLNASLDCRIVVAVQWGRCLSADGGSDAVVRGIADTLKRLFDKCPREGDLLAALSYFPLLAADVPDRGSLLTPYLQAAQSGSLSGCAVYWEGLHRLLAAEDVQHIRSNETCLLRLLSSVSDGKEVSGLLVRNVFFLLNKMGAAAFLHNAVFASTDLLRVVCGGLSSEAMTDRCATLEYLDSAACTAVTLSKPSAHVENPVQRKLLQETRDYVLAATLPALSDKKRLVRQTAGRCRNTWCRVK